MRPRDMALDIALNGWLVVWVGMCRVAALSARCGHAEIGVRGLSGLHRECGLSNRNGRRFSAHVATDLTFESPIDISTYLELNHEQSVGIVSSGIGHDGTLLGDRCALLCSLAACTTTALNIDIEQVSLETPPWLELRTGGDVPRISLAVYVACEI